MAACRQLGFDVTDPAYENPIPSVGIDLKELGGQLPKCLKFCSGIEI